jgi:protein-S-isoprenylcysteine O-methyltransferase Ste14
MWALARFVPGLAAEVAGRDIAGWVLALTGLVVELAGIAAFMRARTTADPTHPSHASSLVTNGIYRRTRNPMYVGDALMLAGWAAHLGSVPALAGVALFIAYIGRFQIPAEERAMASLFGVAYDTYRGRVRRWV